MFVAAIIHFKSFIYYFYVLILYSFVLASSWVWRCIAETYSRVHKQIFLLL